MTTSPAKELSFARRPSNLCVMHRLASLLLLLYLLNAAIAALSIATVLHASAQHIDIVPSIAHTATPSVSSTHNVLVFQICGKPAACCLMTQTIPPPSSHDPPTCVLIVTPTDNGTYPVILFKHGFVLSNHFYTQLFESLAASGYIIVAPQTVTLASNCTEEIEQTAEVANWISKSLAMVLKTSLSSTYDVVPDLSQLVMAGHSRGGKVAFAVALGMASIEIPSFSALVTLDPVDGISSDFIMYPPIVEAGCKHTRNQLSIPVLILGTGYGSYTGFLRPLACAPACCSHMAYFNCTSSPIMYHLVASDYGHLDFLDDSQKWTGLVCKGGCSKAPLRNFSAKLMVAFLESALDQGQQEAINSIIENWERAPITLEEPLVFTKEDRAHAVLERERIQYETADPQEAIF